MAGQEIHHWVPEQIWNTTVQSRLPTGGATLPGFSDEVQKLFHTSTVDLARHSNHPRLTSLTEVLLRRHVELNVGELASIGSYKAKHAKEFLDILQGLAGTEQKATAALRSLGLDPKTHGAIVDAFQMFYTKAAPRNVTRYRRALPVILEAMYNLQRDRRVAAAAQTVISRSQSLQRALRAMARAGGPELVKMTKAVVTARKAVTRAASKATAKVVMGLAAGVAILGAAQKAQALEDERRALKEEFKNADAVVRSQIMQRLEQLADDESEIWTDLAVDVIDAFLPIPFVLPLLNDLRKKIKAEEKEAQQLYDQLVGFADEGRLDAREVAQQSVNAIYLACIAIARQRMDDWVTSTISQEWLDGVCKKAAEAADKKSGGRIDSSLWSLMYLWRAAGGFSFRTRDAARIKMGPFRRIRIDKGNRYAVYEAQQMHADGKNDAGRRTLRIQALVSTFDVGVQDGNIIDGGAMTAAQRDQYRRGFEVDAGVWPETVEPPTPEMRLADIGLSIDEDPAKGLDELLQEQATLWQKWKDDQIDQWNNEHWVKIKEIVRD